MAFRFNPFTGNFDRDQPSTGGSSSDTNLITGQLCDSGVAIGDAVYLSGGTAQKAIATSLATSQVVGFVVAKASATSCTIRVAGISEAIFSGKSEGQDYFLSESVAGAIQSARPPSGFGYVAVNLGFGYSSTRLVIQIMDRMQLS